LLFDGSNDYIICGHDDSLDIIAEITISVWVNNAVSSGTQMILEKVPSGTNGYNLLTGIFQRRLYVNSIASIENVRDGLWHNLVMKNKIGVDEWKLYVDGKVVATKNGVTILPSTTPLYIRARVAGTSLSFKGLIDEVRIYDVAISGELINKNYLAGLNNLYAKGLISEREYNNRLAEK